MEWSDIFCRPGLSNYRAQSFAQTLLNIFFWTTLFLGPFSVGAGALNENGCMQLFFFVCFLPLPVEVFVLVTR